MKTKEIIIIGSLILAGIYFSTQRKPYPNFPLVPPPPPNPIGTQVWASWALTIFNAYGVIRQLWEPGGPFYGTEPTDAAYQELPGIDVSNIV